MAPVNIPYITTLFVRMQVRKDDLSCSLQFSFLGLSDLAKKISFFCLGETLMNVQAFQEQFQFQGNSKSPPFIEFSHTEILWLLMLNALVIEL